MICTYVVTENSTQNGSSSLAWVEVSPHDDESSAQNKSIVTTSTSENNMDKSDQPRWNVNLNDNKKSVGIQANSKVKNAKLQVKTDVPKKSKARGTQFSQSCYQSNYQYHQGYHQCNLNCKNHHHTNGSVPTNYGTATISIGNSEHCQAYYVPVQCQCYGMSVQGAGAGTSLQSKSNINTNTNTNAQSKKTKDSKSSSSSTEVTPTCQLIDELINNSDSSVQKHGYAALENHRYSLVRKMRKELHHLAELNK